MIAHNGNLMKLWKHAALFINNGLYRPEFLNLPDPTVEEKLQCPGLDSPIIEHQLFI
jgi:hypothetical protein